MNISFAVEGRRDIHILQGKIHEDGQLHIKANPLVERMKMLMTEGQRGTNSEGERC